MLGCPSAKGAALDYGINFAVLLALITCTLGGLPLLLPILMVLSFGSFAQESMRRGGPPPSLSHGSEQGAVLYFLLTLGGAAHTIVRAGGGSGDRPSLSSRPGQAHALRLDSGERRLIPPSPAPAIGKDMKRVVSRLAVAGKAGSNRRVGRRRVPLALRMTLCISAMTFTLLAATG